jgi:hypothetical protein
MKYTTCVILMMFILLGKLPAQETNALKPQPNNELVLQKEFINKIDSLFVHQQYTAIIEECNKEQPYYNQKAADYNLIAAYYFMGAKEKSFTLLENKIKSYATVFSMIDILMGDYTGYRQFVEVPKIKTYLMNKIYQKLEEENVADKRNAKILLDFYIEDQFIRHMSKGYTKGFSNTRFPYEHLIDGSTTLYKAEQTAAAVFEFYNKTGKLFSKEEVGSINTLQRLLIFHEKDISRRDFYLGLLKEAVKKEIFLTRDEINFQIATEMVERGNISKYPPSEIIEKYRKQYNMPDYNYSFF